MVACGRAMTCEGGAARPLSTSRLNPMGGLAASPRVCRIIARRKRRREQAMGTEEHAVVIVGGGPTGMMLAAELALAGVDAVIVERRAEPQLHGSRSGGLQARTIEVLDQRGVGERFVSEGQP